MRTSFGDLLSSSDGLCAKLQAQELGLVLAELDSFLDELGIRHDGGIFSPFRCFSTFLDDPQWGS